MEKFNLEFTLGKLMEKVDNIEKNVADIKQHLDDKVSKSEYSEALDRIAAIEEAIQPMLDREKIKKNDKRRFEWLFKNAPAIFWVGSIIIALWCGAGWHASLHVL